MPPRSQDTVCLTACPHQRSQYCWKISYSFLSHRGTWAIWQSQGQGGEGEDCVSRTQGGRVLSVQTGLAGCVLVC